MELTKRELQILYLISIGLTNKEIATKFYLSVNTIDTYRRRLFLKFNVKNAAELVSFAYEQKILPFENNLLEELELVDIH